MVTEGAAEQLSAVERRKAQQREYARRKRQQGKAAAPAAESVSMPGDPDPKKEPPKAAKPKGPKPTVDQIDRNVQYAAALPNNAAAEWFDDPRFRLSREELEELTEPIRETIILMGWEHHVRKVFPVAAISVLLKVEAPRIRLFMEKLQRPQGRTPRPQPSFRRQRQPEQPASQPDGVIEVDFT